MYRGILSMLCMCTYVAIIIYIYIYTTRDDSPVVRYTYRIIYMLLPYNYIGVAARECILEIPRVHVFY